MRGLALASAIGVAAWLAPGVVVVSQPPSAPSVAQTPPGTDIWLARLAPGGALDGPVNVTARPGYDNQPSFTPDSTRMLFTRGDDGQMDIWAYDVATRSSAPTRITNTPESEYSPTVTPDGNGISVIRVERDGTQRLWRFTLEGRSPSLILPGLQPVGYHAWLGPDTLALFVLGTPNTLQLADVRTGRSEVVAERIGRSLHRIPGQEAFSFLHITEEGRWIKRLDPRAREATSLVRAPDTGDGDYAWTPDGVLLMAQGDRLMRWRPGDTEWTEAANLAAYGLRSVTRLAVSPNGRWIALVTADAEPDLA